jgi:hypothetical protein
MPRAAIRRGAVKALTTLKVCKLLVSFSAITKVSTVSNAAAPKHAIRNGKSPAFIMRRVYAWVPNVGNGVVCSRSASKLRFSEQIVR